MLYLIPTPIGNLEDITLRSLKVLQSVDGIICEDTRRTSLLLNHFQIRKPLLVLNDFNEQRQFPEIIARLQSGQDLALVSDAGTPLISDPGYKLVRACLEKQIPIDSLPGPTSVITALTLSGLPPDKFIFLGYFPEKPGARQKLFSQIKFLHTIFPITLIALISPYKLLRTLEEMRAEFGASFQVVLAKELTKIHQKVETKSIMDWLEVLTKQPPKGEYIMLFHQ